MRNLRGGRRPEAVSLKAEAANLPGRLDLVEIDVIRADQVASGVAAAERLAGGGLDVLVSNAGIGLSGPLELHDEAALEAEFQTNLLGGLRMARAVLPGMRARGWGRIVTVTSTSVREVIDGLALSNATRAGVAGAVRTLAREVAADGVTVNNVLPGPILTDRMRQLLSSQPDLDAAIAARGAQNPTGRVGDPAEVGDLVAFLASDRAAFISGASVMIDGGESRVVG
jgi:3-oxoacyl-[acyl-carrier protein] reductase